MPVVWLSKLLGQSLKERVTGLDLFIPLLEAMEKRKKSVFLLGGSDKVIKNTVNILKEKYPHLRIVGAISPFIHYQGTNLINAEEKDALLIEEINKAKPDALFLNLGNPKQEIWFSRVQKKLLVPFTIGIGGTFEKIAGNFSRAPLWMQKSGLEWLHRLFQEPIRLGKRYGTDFLKLFYLCIPLIIYHNINSFFCHLFYKKQCSTVPQESLLFISPKQTIVILPLPIEINTDYCPKLKQQLDNALHHDVVLLDFREVKHIDLAGFALLILELQEAKNHQNQIYSFGINTDIRCLMKLHRIWDLIKNETFPEISQTVEFLLQTISPQDFYETVQQSGNKVTISFLGKLDNLQDFDKYTHKLLPMISKKNVILNFSYCTMIDSRGFSFLLKLQNYIEKEGGNFKIYGLDKSLKMQFYIAQLDKSFQFINSLK
jgi:N-acetylglucosaminyldiphosphoundecaprenol N-acetyl-beta-D-mannosaminyltransferase